MQRRFLKWLFVFISGIALTLPVTNASAWQSRHKKTSKSKQKKNPHELAFQLHSVRVQIKQKRKQIRETKRQERKLSNEIVTVETRLIRTENALGRNRRKRKEVQLRQELLQKRIVATEARLKGRKIVLASRIRQNYERGNRSYLQVLLGSRSLHDYMSRSYYVERVVDSDVHLVEGIKVDKEQLFDDKKEQDAKASELKQIQEQLKEETAQYQEDRDAKRELIRDIHSKRASLEEALDQMEASSHDIESAIRAAQRTPRGQARMRKAWTGSFIQPADGPIRSGFGSRYHPILHRTRMHTGVDIGARYGSSIHAAAGGEVIFAGYRGGYGNCIVVDHGGGVSTLYGHCSSIRVSTGQQVSQGFVIGKVGATGMATGPHLHFEVRHNGVPVNPQ